MECIWSPFMFLKTAYRAYQNSVASRDRRTRLMAANEILSNLYITMDMQRQTAQSITNEKQHEFNDIIKQFPTSALRKQNESSIRRALLSLKSNQGQLKRLDQTTEALHTKRLQIENQLNNLVLFETVTRISEISQSVTIDSEQSRTTLQQLDDTNQNFADIDDITAQLTQIINQNATSTNLLMPDDADFETELESLLTVNIHEFPDVPNQKPKNGNNGASPLKSEAQPPSTTVPQAKTLLKNIKN